MFTQTFWYDTVIEVFCVSLVVLFTRLRVTLFTEGCDVTCKWSYLIKTVKHVAWTPSSKKPKYNSRFYRHNNGSPKISEKLAGHNTIRICLKKIYNEICLTF